MYKCVKGFSLEICDDDGGGEVRLENNDGYWLEISKETLEESFEPVIKVFKTCFEGNYCAHETLEHAKEMIICDIEYDTELTKEEIEKYKQEINELTEEDLEEGIYQAGEYSLETGEMTEEEFNNLPEFEGY